MASKYLGDEFDIHGGGLDLRFPTTRTSWLNPGRRTALRAVLDAQRAGDHCREKMSKSLDNSALVSEVIKRFPARAVRLYLIQPHYRSPIEYSDAAIAESVAALGRIDNFVDRATERVAAGRPRCPKSSSPR